MSDSTSQTARLTLETLVDVLDTLPIPSPFKEAVLAIPKTSLKIMEISQGVRRNKEDAVALTLYISKLTNSTLRPLERIGARQPSPAMQTAMTDFLEALHQVETEMGRWKSQNPWKRIVGYAEDSVVVAAFKEKIEEARRIIDEEISVTTLVSVEDTNAIAMETHGVVEDTHAVLESTSHVVWDTNAIVSDTHVVAENTDNLMVESNAVARATHAGIVGLDSRLEVREIPTVTLQR
ncbi:hypothetical protein FRB94_008442 [Tulasnella sp. JGI-2019a]|nr:hypothetical protein FRB94_008442 [Tulasnella sp. JGI-2019a]KAG8999151.1 hypothetical protein FRB93_013308 [Tulasnella sp. JGI-2019a]